MFSKPNQNQLSITPSSSIAAQLCSEKTENYRVPPTHQLLMVGYTPYTTQ